MSAQDHKRLLDNDEGPNTGGMGAVSPATTLTLEGHKQIMQEVILPTIAGMAAENRRYQGVLYAGIMMTDKGPKTLEFNARFGDPETQAIQDRVGERALRLRGDREQGLPRSVGQRPGRERTRLPEGPERRVRVPRRDGPEGRQGRHRRRPRPGHHGARREPRGRDPARLRGRRQGGLRRHAVPQRHRPARARAPSHFPERTRTWLLPPRSRPSPS
jgi:hypothetical protein